jgi:DNA-binding transcriptional ArsR family regulator
MEEKILIDRKVLQALGVGTRLSIMKLLLTKEHTMSELSEAINLEKSTVKEHLDVLVSAGLVNKEDTKRKWKYYSLTRNGRRLIQPKEVQVLFMFALTFVALIPLELILWQKLANAVAPPLLTGSGSRGMFEGIAALYIHNPGLFSIIVITQTVLILCSVVFGYYLYMTRK